MMALHLHNYPIKQSNVPESAEKSRGHKTVNVSKTSADMLKKLQKPNWHQSAKNMKLPQCRSQWRNMDKKQPKCVYKCGKDERLLNKAQYKAFCMGTVEAVSGIIAFYLVVRDWCIIQRSGQHAGRLWSVEAKAWFEVCVNLSRNVLSQHHWQSTTPHTAEKLTQIMINE